uniref:Uncharacterized protein n=1 Tax=Meloidogyne hapla TaxID=6305 RepID=A0A1I8BS83_MELHA
MINFSIYFCTSWLAGIKLKDGFFGNKNYKLSKEEKKKHCDEIMKILKIDIEIRVKMPGVTEDLKIHIITQGDIENWGFDVKHHDLD